MKKRYKEEIPLSPLNDELEIHAHNSLVGKKY